MTKNAAIKLAIKALRCYLQEHYGNGSKYHEDKLAEYNKYQEVIRWLESMKDTKKGGD